MPIYFLFHSPVAGCSTSYVKGNIKTKITIPDRTQHQPASSGVNQLQHCDDDDDDDYGIEQASSVLFRNQSKSRPVHSSLFPFYIVPRAHSPIHPLANPPCNATYDSSRTRCSDETRVRPIRWDTGTRTRRQTGSATSSRDATLDPNLSQLVRDWRRHRRRALAVHLPERGDLHPVLSSRSTTHPKRFRFRCTDFLWRCLFLNCVT